MSDRIVDAFDFSGRLGFAGRQRLERKLMLLALIPWVGFGGMVALGLRWWSTLPLLLLAPLMVILVAAHVRRMHDLGLHARAVWVRHILVFMLFLAPLVAAAAGSALPEWVRWSLGILAGCIAIGALVRSVVVLPLDWRRGDPEANEFGPPPAA